MRRILVMLFLVSLISAWTVSAQERIELKGTSISGNLQLPSSDTNVPWAATRSSMQKSGSVIMFTGHVLGKRYTPVHRHVFERLIRQYESEEQN